jgi:hypothetical protein
MNWFLQNDNNADMHGLHGPMLTSIGYSLEEGNKILAARGLPELVMYDTGYYDASGTFHTFIPDGQVTVVGKRTIGERIGELALTRTLHKLGQDGQPSPGFFAFIEVNGQGCPDGNIDTALLGASGNPKITVTSGFYGGPLLFYPASVISMNVGEA